MAIEKKKNMFPVMVTCMYGNRLFPHLFVCVKK